VSRRNNQDRVNTPVPDTSPTAAAVEQRDSTFSFVVPTEFVELPSEGDFYPEGHPLHGKASIEIKHMTAKEEDILTSESLLRKGIAIERLLQSLMVDKSIKLDDLLVGDKNALIVGARITGYGPDYRTHVSCPSCHSSQEAEFDLLDLENSKSALPEGVERSTEDTFFVPLPHSGISVELRLLTGNEERKYLSTSNRKRKKKLLESSTTDLLRLLIMSVDGYEDVESINNLLEVLPVKDSVHIRKTYEQISPDVDLSQDFECQSCGHEGSIGVPLNADFFWPGR